MRGDVLTGAARRVALAVGVGALGAAVCSTGVHLVRPTGAAPDPLAAFSDAPPRPSSTMGAEERRAVDLLRRAGRAEATVSYRGTKFFSSWSVWGGASVVAEVVHEAGRRTRITVTSGPTGVAAAEAAHQGAGFDAQALTALVGRYVLRIAGRGHCAGRPASVVEAVRKGRVAGRFWVDTRSGLLLRRELYDDRGRPVRATAFLDVSVAAPSRVVATAPSHPSAEPSDRSPTGPGGLGDVDRLRRAGWVLPALLPAGFVLLDAGEVTVDGSRVLKLGYSDGLYTLSLFAQRGQLDPTRLSGFTEHTLGDATVYARSGLHRRLAWSGGDTVYTLITDAPDTAVREVVSVLPHRPPDTGLLARMSEGVARVGSWIDPFG